MIAGVANHVEGVRLSRPNLNLDGASLWGTRGLRWLEV
jgi:hypothetical protein